MPPHDTVRVGVPPSGGLPRLKPELQRTVQQLTERMRQLETTFRLSAPLRIPLAGGLDAVFPEEGLSAGSLVELLPSEPGVGAWTLALILARHACGERKT